MLRKLGRVDHRDTFLDTHVLERDRGITIFSKQARIKTDEREIILLDTPGHADLSGETERAVAAMDIAILVISGTDGVQAHTDTLWLLLLRAKVPTFIFVTKMDTAKRSRDDLLQELTEANVQAHRLQLRGLDPDTVYAADGLKLTGSALMNAGILMPVMSGDHQAVQIEIKAL